MRAAIYWAPELSDPLWAAGGAWLGRDVETGAALAQPSLDGIAELTEAPRRYGFHATLKPPFRIATHWDDLRDAVRSLARRHAPFALPPLRIESVHGFMALRESVFCSALQALADDGVVALDRHREPPDEAERARRRLAGLSDAEARNLARYGYPYVLDTWFFHMTLSRRLDDATFAAVESAASAHFAAALSVSRSVESLCLFTEAEPGAPLLLAERFRLGA